MEKFLDADGKSDEEFKNQWMEYGVRWSEFNNQDTCLRVVALCVANRFHQTLIYLCHELKMVVLASTAVSLAQTDEHATVLTNLLFNEPFAPFHNHEICSSIPACFEISDAFYALCVRGFMSAAQLLVTRVSRHNQDLFRAVVNNGRLDVARWLVTDEERCRVLWRHGDVREFVWPSNSTEDVFDVLMLTTPSVKLFAFVVELGIRPRTSSWTKVIMSCIRNLASRFKNRPYVRFAPSHCELVVAAFEFLERACDDFDPFMSSHCNVWSVVDGLAHIANADTHAETIELVSLTITRLTRRFPKYFTPSAVSSFEGYFFHNAPYSYVPPCQHWRCIGVYILQGWVTPSFDLLRDVIHHQACAHRLHPAVISALFKGREPCGRVETLFARLFRIPKSHTAVCVTLEVLACEDPLLIEGVIEIAEANAGRLLDRPDISSQGADLICRIHEHRVIVSRMGRLGELTSRFLLFGMALFGELVSERHVPALFGFIHPTMALEMHRRHCTQMPAHALYHNRMSSVSRAIAVWFSDYSMDRWMAYHYRSSLYAYPTDKCKKESTCALAGMVTLRILLRERRGYRIVLGPKNLSSTAPLPPAASMTILGFCA